LSIGGTLWPQPPRINSSRLLALAGVFGVGEDHSYAVALHFVRSGKLKV
jgi:hypothetical protein